MLRLREWTKTSQRAVIPKYISENICLSLHLALFVWEKIVPRRTIFYYFFNTNFIQNQKNQAVARDHFVYLVV